MEQPNQDLVQRIAQMEGQHQRQVPSCRRISCNLRQTWTSKDLGIRQLPVFKPLEPWKSNQESASQARTLKEVLMDSRWSERRCLCKPPAAYKILHTVDNDNQQKPKKNMDVNDYFSKKQPTNNENRTSPLVLHNFAPKCPG